MCPRAGLQRISSILVSIWFSFIDIAATNVYNIFFRNQGIWNHIKNDEELFKDIQCVRDVMKLSFLLSEKLSKKRKACQLFLQDLSSSLFFIVALPQFVQNNVSELNR
jgi:hypothetical protein